MATLHRIPARAASIDGLGIRRVLPVATCRKVGPWIFVDHFGPQVLTPTTLMDVRPHPHIGLSTVSFLFEGAVEHRDSLGNHVVVKPGEVHWMRAGHGIVHSERTPADVRAAIDAGERRESHGLQLWCAHPDGEEDQEPAFGSWRDLPVLDVGGARVQLLAGNGWGEESPVAVTSTLVYAIASLKRGQRLTLPDHEERCVYPLEGSIAIDGDAAAAHEMLVVDDRARELVANDAGRVVILGGDAIGTRTLWWNLVHSDRDRLRAQAQRWRDGGFPKVPGDDEEFIPAPDGPPL